MQSEKLLKGIESELNKKRFGLGIKRVFDILFSLLLFTILSPFFVCIMIWIKMDSEGEIIFKQKRVGFRGKEFTIYKFRTMIKNADKLFKKEIKREELGDYVFQKEDDMRITRSGRFLRKTSLDELPQLINIIKGDMSIIGPRPEVPYIANLYTKEESIRLLMKPGISGLAQVNGRGDLKLSETISYDILYIKNFSLLLDLRILLKTIRVVIMGKGAY